VVSSEEEEEDSREERGVPFLPNAMDEANEERSERAEQTYDSE
jgi:hypothetical protein